MSEPRDDLSDISCPVCDSCAMKPVQGTHGTYECTDCGARTHEKIEEHRADLQALADSDNPAGKLAALLLGGRE